MRFLALLFIFLNCNLLRASTVTIAEKEITEIVHHLHHINGNFLRGEAPTVFINETMNNGASYNPVKHTLTVDLEIYRICQAFEQQSSDALAFIIGHELAHCYMEHDHFSEFNNYDKIEGASLNEEIQADFYGLFMAYLAGYDSFSVIPELLESIYASYELDNQLDGYSPLQERMEITKTVQGQLKELISIYEAANYLSVIGKYQLATASYQHALKYYQGREFYNNLAINHILEALHFTQKDIDWYLFPIELDCNTRMKMPKLDRGDEDLTEAEKAYRLEHLIAAKSTAEMAAKLDPNYIPAKTNLICILTLMGQYQEAIAYYNNWIKNKNDEKAQLAIAIAMSHLSSYQEQARTLYQKLAQSKNKHIAFQATYNLRILNEGICGTAEAFYCFEPITSPNYVDEVRLYRQQNSMPTIELPTNYRLAIQYLPSSTLLVYKKNNTPVFKLQLISAKHQFTKKDLAPDAKYKMVASSKGYFILCESKRTVFYMTASNKLQSWSKYY